MRIIGHRGARGEAPENTLGGFQYLKDLGITAVEFDVRQDAAYELLVMHDDNFLRTTGIDQNFYTADQLARQHLNQANIWMDWGHEVTPLLSQSLALMSQFEHIEVEIKAVDSMQAAETLVTALELQLRDFAHNAVITSFDHKILTALASNASSFRRGLLIEDPNLNQPIELALTLGCCQIGWMDQLASHEKIKATHAAGLNVSVWTVNDIVRAQQLQDLGVQGLITDFPKRMQQQLKL